MPESTVIFMGLKKLLNESEMEEITKESMKIHKWVPNDLFVMVSWNPRLQTTAGTCRVRYSREADDTPFKWIADIKLNPKYYKTFGYERTIKTFLHELAHAIQFAVEGKSNHRRMFKVICKALGGSMNKRFGGQGYFKDAATDKYIRTDYKFLYKCPCGEGQRKMKRRAQRKTLLRTYCKNCGTRMSSFDIINL